MNPQVSVEVPASSANLGPGFDSLGAALDLKLRVSVGPGSGVRVRNTGIGADELPSDDGNLIWRALVAACARAGVDVPSVGLRADNEIPLERGLGSSAAAAVAGAALARALTGAALSDADLIALAADLEGHPDNAAAAVLGGLVVVCDGSARRLEPSGSLQPVLCIATARQATSEARALLPAEVPLATAAANGARAAATLAGLTGAMAFDPGVMRDELHEPARLAAMPAAERLVTELRGAGIGACLSGAGPSVLAVVPAGSDAAIARVRAAAGEDFDVRASRWDLAGAVTQDIPSEESGAA